MAASRSTENILGVQGKGSIVDDNFHQLTPKVKESLDDDGVVVVPCSDQTTITSCSCSYSSTATTVKMSNKVKFLAHFLCYCTTMLAYRQQKELGDRERQTPDLTDVVPLHDLICSSSRTAMLRLAWLPNSKNCCIFSYSHYSIVVFDVRDCLFRLVLQKPKNLSTTPSSTESKTSSENLDGMSKSESEKSSVECAFIVAISNLSCVF